ncbi:hypothetical protein TWF481_006225 [Arthrobotrys musiformis]|uniref:Uncharacterized protein n=1 Tax=Arthrobotrys musiformis TaxID=47236 RepID=A0AAV9WG88_9PEZI
MLPQSFPQSPHHSIVSIGMSWNIAGPEPPRIPKPSRDSKSGEQFGIELIHKQFKIPYYGQMTGNWQNIKFKTIIMVLKRLCEPAVEGETLISSWRLEAHSEEIIIRIYNTFRSIIQADSELGDDFYQVLEAMMKSTEEDKWLFFWIVNQIRDKWRRRRSTAGVDSGKDAAGQHATKRTERRGFGIRDLLNPIDQ